MARYKHIDTSPRFIAVDLERQLLPGTLEHALNYLVDHELDLTRFDARYKNDFTGASAYPPGMLLKVVLFAYSRGVVSSREIERACRCILEKSALAARRDGNSNDVMTNGAMRVAPFGENFAAWLEMGFFYSFNV